MKNKIRSLCLYLLPIILILLFYPILGRVYSDISGDRSGFWIGDTESLIFWGGLFLGYAFFIPLIGTLLGKDKSKYKAVGILVGAELILSLLSFRIFLTFLVAALIGWLLGEVILFGYKKLKPAKVPPKIKSAKK